MKKIAIVGTHCTDKSKICRSILNKLELIEDADCVYKNVLSDGFAFIPEQLCEVEKVITKIEERTLATYGKQLYLENLYTAQGKNILCNGSVLDSFIYLRYVANHIKTDEVDLKDYNWEGMGMYNIKYCEKSAKYQIIDTYSKIYLIEPSSQKLDTNELEVHKLFLEYFNDFKNVEIINQENACKEEFIDKIASEFVID